MKRSKKSKVVIASIGILPFLYVVNYFVTPNLVGTTKLEEWCRPRGNLQFDSETWKQATGTSGTRYAMVDDLLASGSLNNLNATQISNLLGKADIASELQGEKQYVYFLANQRTFPAQSLFFPGLFANLDRWMLELRVRGGECYLSRVFFT